LDRRPDLFRLVATLPEQQRHEYKPGEGPLGGQVHITDEERALGTPEPDGQIEKPRVKFVKKEK
jgi:hypothetical protein